MNGTYTTAPAAGRDLFIPAPGSADWRAALDLMQLRKHIDAHSLPRRIEQQRAQERLCQCIEALGGAAL